MSEKSKLRERAEQRIAETHADLPESPDAETSRLLFELQVHHEELEIQNEELRRAHIELQSARDRYADLYEFAPAGYVTLDAEGHILEANLTVARLLKVDRSQLIGARFTLYCAEDSRKQLHAHFQELVSTKSPSTCNLPFRIPGGDELHARLDCTLVQPSQAETRIRVVLTDITEQENATRALLAKDQHLRALTNALPVLISYLDSDLRFQFANSAYVDWFGQQPNELNGQVIKDVLGDSCDDEVADYFFDAINGHRIEFESQLVHRKKGIRHVRMMLIPDANDDGSVKGIHTLTIDITDQKIVEQRNARYRRFSERLNQLTTDEMAVYRLLVQGNSNKVIASELDIGLRTAERRRQIVLEKLNVESLAELLQQLADIQGVGPQST